MTVVQFPPRPSETPDQRAERLWARFVMAAQIAQVTLQVEDGLAAGRAWAEFLKAFEEC
jgi:hypothetical protein